MKRALSAASILVTAAVVLALCAYAWRGWYTRYITDDYCTAAYLHHHGFWKLMVNERAHWSGRFSFYVAKAAMDGIGPISAPTAPGVSLFLLAAIAFWTLRRTLQLSSTALAAMAAAAIAFATFDASPEILAIGGPLVWLTGVVTYTLPLILIMLWLGLFSGKTGIARCIAGAVLMFFAGGFSETSLAAQAAFTGTLGLATLLLRAREETRIALWGFAGTIASAIVVVSAPGNSVRIHQLPRQRSLLEAVLDSPRLAYDYIGSHVLLDGEALLLVVAAGVISGLLADRIRMRGAWTVAIAGLAAYVVSFIPGAWALSSSPPPRALHVSNYFLLIAIGALGAALGVRLRGNAARALRFAVPLLIVLTVIPIHSAIRTVRTIPEGQRNAREVEAIQKALREQRGRDVTIRSPWALRSRVLVAEPEFWTNRCICSYYGARSLRVER